MDFLHICFLLIMKQKVIEYEKIRKKKEII